MKQDSFETIPGTAVEITTVPERGRIRHAIFDFDGTLSYLRDGWQDFMVPLMVEELSACPRHESLEELERLVIDFVDHLTGKQTVSQMIRLTEEIARRGGKPKDPLEYKDEYNRRLKTSVVERLHDLEGGKRKPDDFHVRGARPFLEAVTARGIRCYLASGTDVEFVREEARILDLERYFGDRTFGALRKHETYSKEMVIRSIIKEHDLHGAELLVVGDGYVEIQNGRDVGAVTWGIHTRENNSYHMNSDKRARLLRAGAQLLAPDLSEGTAVLEYLGV